MLSTNFLKAQNWPLPVPTPQPTINCGDVYLVSSTLPNGDLEIAVNYHYSSFKTGPNPSFTEMSSFQVDLSDFGTQGLIPNLSGGMLNGNNNLSNGTVPTLTSANGIISYKAIAVNSIGFHYTSTKGYTNLFKITYQNKIKPYTGGCAYLTVSAQMTTAGPTGSSCPPAVFISGGTSLSGVAGVYGFCSDLQSSQFIPIEGNISPALGSCILEDVDVKILCSTISIPSNTVTDNTVTDAAGNYQSPTNASMIPNNDYIITPSKDDGPLCGVSTLDLVLISKFILNTQPINNWASLIAGDVNKNGTVSTADIVELRRMILGKQILFINNTSWRFFDKKNLPQVNISTTVPPGKTTFTTNVNQERILIKTLTNANNSANDFLGVKIGDVSGNWCDSKGNGCALAQRPPRENGDHEIWIDDVAARQDDKFEINVRTGEDYSPLVYSTGISINNEMVEILEIVPSERFGISDDNFNIDVEKGDIKMLWALERENPIGLRKGTLLFKIIARAKQNISTLEEVVNLNDNLFENVTYTADEETIGHALVMKYSGASYRQLGKNKDNQTSSEAIATLSEAGQSLTLKYYTPQAGNTSLAVYDLQGRLVLQKKIESILGYNSIDIDFNNQKQSEMYLYYLETPKFPISGKIIKINH